MAVSSLFARNLKIVTVFHVLIVLMLVGWTTVRGCIGRKHEIRMPVQILMQPRGEPMKIEQKKTEQVVQERPVAARTPKTTVKKPPKTTSPKTTSPKTTSPRPQPVKVPTVDEIRKKLLEAVATPSDRDLIPDDESLYFELVRRTFYDVWVQPSIEEAGNASVLAEIEIEMNGAVSAWKIVKRAGVPALDESVAHVLGAVRRIDGLSAGFLKEHSTITITFKVDQGVGN